MEDVRTAPFRTRSRAAQALRRSRRVVAVEHRSGRLGSGHEAVVGSRPWAGHDAAVVGRNGRRADRHSSRAVAVECDGGSLRDDPGCSHVAGRDGRSSHPEVGPRRIHDRRDSLANGSGSARAGVECRFEA